MDIMWGVCFIHKSSNDKKQAVETPSHTHKLTKKTSFRDTVTHTNPQRQAIVYTHVVWGYNLLQSSWSLIEQLSTPFWARYAHHVVQQCALQMNHGVTTNFKHHTFTYIRYVIYTYTYKWSSHEEKQFPLYMNHGVITSFTHPYNHVKWATQ